MGAPALEDNLPTVVRFAKGEELIVLLKKDPITNYPKWAQWLLHIAYWLTNYDGGIELVTVCTDEDTAAGFAKNEGYRGIWLIVNEPLPDQPCQWKPAIHFRSPFRKRYERYAPEMVALKRTEVETMYRMVKSLVAS